MSYYDVYWKHVTYLLRMQGYGWSDDRIVKIFRVMYGAE